MQERTGCPTCSIGWSFALWRQVPYGAAGAVPPTSAGLWWPPRDGGDKAPVCSPGCGPCSARCCRGLQFAPRAAELTAGNAPPNVARLGQSPHIHIFREKLGFGKGKGSEHPLHLHPAACRHGDGAGTGCGSWGQSSPRTTPGLLLLLLPRQRQYDLLKLFLFPSSSSSVVCVRKTNCLIIVLISNHVTFSVTLQSR